MEIAQDTQFIKDHTGQNVYAIIPIDRYNSYIEYEKMMEKLEDKEDLKTIEERKNEPAFPAEDVFREIREKRAMNG